MMIFGNKSLAAATLVVAASALGACSSSTPAPIASAPPPVVVAKPAPRPAAPALVFGAPDDASVWRLRSGLNVAALTCTGNQRVAVEPAYRQLLKRHEQLLNTAYRAEVNRNGMRKFDHEQTKIYNRFSQQRSPVKFCQTAAQIASEAVRMDSTKLWPSAPEMVAKLERGLG